MAQKTSWLKVNGEFRWQATAVKDLCERLFGPEHKITLRRTTGQLYDNHGNWTLRFGGDLCFRYKKDMTWFLLQGGHLMDPA